MLKTGWRAALVVALVSVVMLGGCTGNSAPFDTTTLGILFVTQTMPAAGAGQLFDVVIEFGTTGGAALPDRYQLTFGVLPSGLQLLTQYVGALDASRA